MEERLQKYMAKCGVASRRKCEELILSGVVQVNGEKIVELGTKVNPEVDTVMVNGKKISYEENKVYIMLNKPTKVVCTVKDERNRKTVIDIIDVKERIYPIGRLDYDTSGMLLLTNDGDVYNRLMHPRNIVKKKYIAHIKGKPTPEEIKKFKTGIDIDGYITAEADFKLVGSNKGLYIAEIAIHEGKNRQIRKMCEAIGHPVVKLKRKSIGKLGLQDLELGKWRHLTKEEVEYISSL